MIFLTTAQKRGINTTKYTEDVSHITDSRPYSIHHTTVKPGTKQALYLHCHNEMEILYLYKGELEFHIEERVYTMKAGQAVFISSNRIHHAVDASDNADGCEYYAVVFSPEMISGSALTRYCDYFSQIGFAGTEGLRVFDDKKDGTLINALLMIFSCIDKPAAKSELLIRGQLLTIWQELYNEFIYSRDDGDCKNRSYADIQKTAEYICENYADNISLAVLAEMAGVSEGHFCRQFKRFAGFPPFEFINRQRIMRACEMLQHTDERIADVATYCGYNNVSYFNRTFQKYMRESPKQYRNRTAEQKTR